MPSSSLSSPLSTIATNGYDTSDYNDDDGGGHNPLQNRPCLNFLHTNSAMINGHRAAKPPTHAECTRLVCTCVLNPPNLRSSCARRVCTCVLNPPNLRSSFALAVARGLSYNDHQSTAKRQSVNGLTAWLRTRPMPYIR